MITRSSRQVNEVAEAIAEQELRRDRQMEKERNTGGKGDAEREKNGENYYVKHNYYLHLLSEPGTSGQAVNLKFSCFLSMQESSEDWGSRQLS